MNFSDITAVVYMPFLIAVGLYVMPRVQLLEVKILLWLTVLGLFGNYLHHVSGGGPVQHIAVYAKKIGLFPFFTFLFPGVLFDSPPTKVTVGMLRLGNKLLSLVFLLCVAADSLRIRTQLEQSTLNMSSFIFLGINVIMFCVVRTLNLSLIAKLKTGVSSLRR